MKTEKANIAYERQPGISGSSGKNVNKAAVSDATCRHDTSEATKHSGVAEHLLPIQIYESELTDSTGSTAGFKSDDEDSGKDGEIHEEPTLSSILLYNSDI
ncbi:hypothetical protein E2C01_032971 [Portunus trituberculatus]|uniref:Uncharacterized protein n=1 Tax=Portunus trituberculatus TaxID=210409 RepID=A0A5B7F163_PORTR|nr:hypothetical protein [Portunus trituberculatus]